MDMARSGRRYHLALYALLLGLVLAACGNDDTEPGAAQEPEETEDAEEGAAAVDDPMEPLQERASVRVGAARVVNLAPTWLLEETADAYNVDVEYVEFGRFADARTALAAGEIDFTTFGPQDIVLAMAEGSDNLVGLAGAGSGNDALVVAEGSGIEDWSDLEGRSVGIGAGSISWVKFAASVQEHGVDYANLNIVNIAGGGTAYIQAMERGDIDVAVLWEPFAAQAGEAGVGEYPPFDHNESEVVGSQFAVFSTTRDYVEERPEVVQVMVNAYVDAVEELQGDQDRWVSVAEDYSGLSTATIETAIARSELGYELDLPRIVNIAEFLVDNGIVSGVESDDLRAAHDYSFLSNRTGMSREELGAE